MSNPTRFTKLGVSGGTGTDENTQDTFLQCIEVPFKAQGSGSKIDSGVAAPASFSPVGGYVAINVPETQGATQEVSIGMTGAGASGSIYNQIDTATIGKFGNIIKSVIDNNLNENFAFTMPNTNIECEGVAVIWFTGGDL